MLSGMRTRRRWAGRAVSALLSQTQKVTPFPGMAGCVKEVRLLEGPMWTMGARRVLEIGTFTGATAMALAEALPSHGAGSRSTPMRRSGAWQDVSSM